VPKAEADVTPRGSASMFAGSEPTSSCGSTQTTHPFYPENRQAGENEPNDYDCAAATPACNESANTVDLMMGYLLLVWLGN